MKGNNILSSLSYFSIFFAPFLLPIIIYFVAEEDVKYHAKKALMIHFIPYIAIIVSFGITLALASNSMNEQLNTVVAIGVFTIAGIISIYYFIWNIVKGVKVLKKQETNSTM
jgi:cytochrome c biogenesis factor